MATPLEQEYAHGWSALAVLGKPGALVAAMVTCCGPQGDRCEDHALWMPLLCTSASCASFFGLNKRSHIWGSATPRQLMGGLAVFKCSMMCGCRFSHPISATSARGGVRYSAGMVSMATMLINTPRLAFTQCYISNVRRTR